MTANGLAAGTFQAPQFNYLFPENLVMGSPTIPLPFQEFPFLVNGFGPYVPFNAGPTATAVGTIGQLSPWPSVTAPTATCTTGQTLLQPPVANAGPPQTVSSGANVTLDGIGSSDPNTPPLTRHLHLDTGKWACSVAARSQPREAILHGADGSRRNHHARRADVPIGYLQRLYLWRRFHRQYHGNPSHRPDRQLDRNPRGKRAARQHGNVECHGFGRYRNAEVRIQADGWRDSELDLQREHGFVHCARDPGSRRLVVQRDRHRRCQ